MQIKTFTLGAAVALSLALAGPLAASTKSTIVTSAQMVKMNQMSGDFETLLNQTRARNGANPVVRNSRLDKVAHQHASEMHKRDELTHRSKDGAGIFKRVKRSGYCARLATENVAEGWPNDASVFAAWMNSAGHRKNNLNKKVKEYGYARVGDYYALVFAKPCK